MVHKFNLERKDDDNAGNLSISTYDITDFFMNVDTEVFLADIRQARVRIRERFPGASFF